MHMLGSKAHADKARRNPAKHREPVKQLHGKGHRWLPLQLKHIADDSALNEDLQSLRHLGWPLASPLHLDKESFGHGALAKGQCEDVGGSHSVLNGKIDADAADWGHSVRRIANTKQS